MTCRCGHNRASHEHYSRHTACLCGCPKWRRKWFR